MHPMSILRRPVITEKSTDMQEYERRYVFEVSPAATKHQIKWAVELAFSVKVLKINTMNVRGKKKKYGPKATAKRSWKKAMVTLAPGDTITIFEGV